MSIDETIERLKKYGRTITSRYECDTCQDTGLIMQGEGRDMKVFTCQCQKDRIFRQMLVKSGLGSNDMTMESFMTDTPLSRKLKEVATEYIDSYPQSLLLCGQPGSGKTHIMIGIIRELIKKGVDIQYISYTTGFQTIRNEKINGTDEQKLQAGKEFERLRTCGLLAMDDVFKTPPTVAEIKDLFDIINHRYLNGKPFIITTERIVSELVGIDEALGSRISQQAGKNTVVISRDNSKNRRINRDVIRL